MNSVGGQYLRILGKFVVYQVWVEYIECYYWLSATPSIVASVNLC